MTEMAEKISFLAKKFLPMTKNKIGLFVHFLQNDVVLSVQKYNCDLGLEFALWLWLGLHLGLGLGLAEIRFRSNVFSSKCSRSQNECEYRSSPDI